MKKKKEDIFKENIIETTNDIFSTNDSTSKFKKRDIKKNRGMALMCYIFVLIPLFFEKKSEFVKYHVIQGFNLFCCFIIYTIFYGLIMKFARYEIKCVRNGFVYSCGKYSVHWIFELPLLLIGLILFAFSVAGIINVINGKAKQLPIIGKFNVLKKLHLKM